VNRKKIARTLQLLKNQKVIKYTMKINDQLFAGSFFSPKKILLIGTLQTDENQDFNLKNFIHRPVYSLFLFGFNRAQDVASYC